MSNRKFKDSYGRESTAYSELGSTDYYAGEIESIKQKLDNVTEVLARLVERMPQALAGEVLGITGLEWISDGDK